MDRADGCCESCGMGALNLEMDHFFGGSLKRIMERFEACWALCRMCHNQKTISWPSRIDWLKRFIDHCDMFGYAVESDLARVKLDAARLRR